MSRMHTQRKENSSVCIAISHRVIDVANASDKMFTELLDTCLLRWGDKAKFVPGNRESFDWSKLWIAIDAAGSDIFLGLAGLRSGIRGNDVVPPLLPFWTDVVGELRRVIELSKALEHWWHAEDELLQRQQLGGAIEDGFWRREFLPWTLFVWNESGIGGASALSVTIDTLCASVIRIKSEIGRTIVPLWIVNGNRERWWIRMHHCNVPNNDQRGLLVRSYAFEKQRRLPTRVPVQIRWSPKIETNDSLLVLFRL